MTAGRRPGSGGLIGLLLGVGVSVGGSTLAGSSLEAQTPPGDAAASRPWLFRATGQLGPIVQQSSFLEGRTTRDGTPVDGHWAGRIEWGWQTRGGRSWQRAYGNPVLGVGVYRAGYGHRDELGRPTALYGWFAWPFLQNARVRVSSIWGLGAALGWEPWDPDSNPANTTMGLAGSVLLEGGLAAELHLTEVWGLVGGVQFTHFSNGALREPNSGLNQFGLRLGAQTRLGEARAVSGSIDGTDGATADPSWSLRTRLAAGARSVRFNRTDPEQVERFYADFHPVVGITALGLRSVGTRGRLAIGLDLVYDGSTDARSEVATLETSAQLVDPGTTDRLSLAVLGGWEQVVGEVSAGIRLGYAFLRADLPGTEPRLVQELGLDWAPWGPLSVGLDARFIEFSRSIFLDWGFGYRFGAR